MREILISDTSALIILQKIEQLKLLNLLFDEVFVTTIVKEEFGLDLPNWIKVENPKEKLNTKLLEINLDLGEASSISLALEKENPILLIDEKKGRRIAQKLGFKIIGTISILILGKRKGEITEIKPILEQMKELEFRISDSLIAKALELANEGDDT